MNYGTLASALARVFIVVAFLLVLVATVEYLSNLSGYTVLRHAYSAGRLIELAAALTVIVIALLLRQIRDELRKKA
jgi:hypothetical protein